MPNAGRMERKWTKLFRTQYRNRNKKTEKTALHIEKLFYYLEEQESLNHTLKGLLAFLFWAVCYFVTIHRLIKIDYGHETEMTMLEALEEDFEDLSTVEDFWDWFQNMTEENLYNLEYANGYNKPEELLHTYNYHMKWIGGVRLYQQRAYANLGDYPCG